MIESPVIFNIVWIGISAALVLTGFIIVVTLHSKPCRIYGHDRKYVALRLSGAVLSTDPSSNGRPFNCSHDHKVGEKGIVIVRWICRRCPTMVEECLGNVNDGCWKIEHECLVPDEKAWTNWGKSNKA